VDDDDVGVADAREHAGFTQKSGATIRSVELEAQDFDGHAAVEHGVMGEIHATHATGAQLAFYAVIGGYCALQSL
jgi:hypothetical protein